MTNEPPKDVCGEANVLATGVIKHVVVDRVPRILILRFFPSPASVLLRSDMIMLTS